MKKRIFLTLIIFLGVLLIGSAALFWHGSSGKNSLSPSWLSVIINVKEKVSRAAMEITARVYRWRGIELPATQPSKPTEPLNVSHLSPIVLIPFNNMYIQLNRQGYVIGLIDSTLQADLPLVSGLLVNSAVIGEKIGVQDEKKLELALQTGESCSPLVDQISEIAVGDTEDIRLYTLDGFEIRLGTADKLTEKVNLLFGILQKVRRERTPGVIDLRFTNSPTFRPFTPSSTTETKG